MALEVFFPVLHGSNRNGYGELSPLFPKYVFILCDLAEISIKLMYTSGVRGVVCAGSEAICVAPEIIHSLKERCPGGVARLADVSFEESEAVTIINGPLQGLDGIFGRYRSGRHRVEILLEMLRHNSVRVTLPVSAVSRA